MLLLMITSVTIAALVVTVISVEIASDEKKADEYLNNLK